jgi:UDP-N-acetylmuramoyl-L-alanyl-D-glutamate--2,6-diaminopimelate ligase
MRLAELIEHLPGTLEVSGSLELDITTITSDSRQVTPGALFVAYRGVGADGHRYIDDALARGAAALVVEQRPDRFREPVRSGAVPMVVVQDGRAALAHLHAASFGHPSRSMTVIGVTGTDGKTTTSNLIYSILKAAGVRAGMITTVNAVIGDESYDTGLHTTTPDAVDVQRYLAQMRDAGTQIAVLETTSHGLAQHRVTGVEFDVAVVTNITHEHLDFHGSYEAYRDAKAMLFRSLLGGREGGEMPAGEHGGRETPPLQHPGAGRGEVASPPSANETLRQRKTALLNADDSSYAYLSQIPAERYVVYTAMTDALALPNMAAPVMELRASAVRQEPAGMTFRVDVFEDGAEMGILRLTTRLVGGFNVSNVLAAVGAALALGLSSDAIQAGVAALSGIPGRMERIDRGQDFTAVVDFAHTPNALDKALTTGRELAGPRGRVIAVFGSAGLRDREKRRLMGEVAAEKADYTVITAEDPRTESLDAILAETADAMTQRSKVEGRDFVRVADRQQAILHAVRNARPGDIVLVCGKGHEQSMCFGAIEHPWRDQDALRWALDGLLGQEAPQPPFVLPTWKERSG